MLRLAALCLLADATFAWSLATPVGLQPRHSARAPQQPCMMAKSKKPKRKKGKSSAASQPAYEPVTTASFTESPSGLPVVKTASTSDPDAPVEDRVAAVFRNAGISNSGLDSGALGSSSTPQNADPLSRIPKKGQELLERFFAGGALTFGTVFILSGIAVSAEALAKVLGNPLPVALDEILVQYVEPALTPSILILFGFSISLGLLKQVCSRA